MEKCTARGPVLVHVRTIVVKISQLRNSILDTFSSATFLFYPLFRVIKTNLLSTANTYVPENIILPRGHSYALQGGIQSMIIKSCVEYSAPCSSLV